MNSKKTYSTHLSDKNLLLVCFRCHYLFLCLFLSFSPGIGYFHSRRFWLKFPTTLEQLGHSVIYQCPSGLYCCAISIPVICVVLIVQLITSMNSSIPYKLHRHSFKHVQEKNERVLEGCQNTDYKSNPKFVE